MKKETHLRVRITQEDLLKIKENAKFADLTVSKFVRDITTKGKIIRLDSREKRILFGISNNLNQLTRRANSEGIIPLEVAETLRLIIKKIQNGYS